MPGGKVSLCGVAPSTRPWLLACAGSKSLKHPVPLLDAVHRWCIGGYVQTRP
ncbi:hypothetical protein [Thiothrix subterranea]|uniref:hypothetical protein n=1 Tax=Thiothrix subterranea TaxID=2735563 RepID=UPI00280BE993|nr:hypothetical protein [Thiothrix subterranea]